MITPDIQIPDIIEAEQQPSRTYKIDFDTGRIGGIIDGREAIEQFIIKTIRTARYRYLIYSDDVGCEIEDLIGSDISWELFKSECMRTITEALIYDDRINRVYDFSFRQEEDGVYIDFSVDTVEGTLEISEVFNRV
jgi:hypothetical protein